MAVQMALRAPAKVPQSVFLGFLWSGTALSLCFLAFRLCVKLRAFRKLYVDDYLVVLAWLIKLTTSILWQIKLPAMYEQYAVQSGQKPITPGFFERDAVFLRYIVPLNILFYSCLWAVKISFLVFFRRLGSNVRNQKIWWWFVLILTILAWVACIADIRYQCALGSIEHILTYCSSQASIKWINNTFYGNCAADVVTDCLIVSIPVIMLWNVRLPLRKKILLMAIFSLTVFVMVVAVIRVTIVGSSDRNEDISWAYFWSNIEMTTSIIIACIASFRQFFVKTNKPRSQRSPSKSTSRRGLLSWFQLRRKNDNSTSSAANNEVQGTPDKWDNRSHLVPLDSIHVGYNISVTASNFKMDKD